MSETLQAKRILIVEDDTFVQKVLKEYLDKEGYNVSLVNNGSEMRRCFDSNIFDLVIMDLKLPGEDGISLTRYIKEKYNVGIIILTSMNETFDKVVGLEVGADDYITKPFEERELLARIRSVMRRISEIKASEKRDNNKIYFDGWHLDIKSRVLWDPKGNQKDLTGSEFTLLIELASNPQKVIRRENLLKSVYNRNWNPVDRSIDVLVTRLRHKIENDCKNPKIIKTVRGQGYVFSIQTQIK
ncbi:MAG: response regulator [Alphaproteobacteria bacterium]